MAHTFPDRLIWHSAYQEEHTSLLSEDTFIVIDEATYLSLRSQYGNALPTMCVLCIKVDSTGRPVRAKCRIVVLGNLEITPWTKGDCYAPVAAQVEVRLMVSMSISHNRILKQGDAKNAFCQPTLPSTEVVIVRPPPHCPLSPPNTYWRLRKTLYGLRRSPRHWYSLVKTVMGKMHLFPCPHAPCLFFGSPVPNEAPIYVVIYVDDMCYFSTSDLVEHWFESTLQSYLRIDFMGEVSWFLGTHYAWSCLPNGSLRVHMSQTGTVDSLLSKFQLSDCNPTLTPYRSGLTIDMILADPSPDPSTISKYQSLVGSLNWLSLSTRPDISAVVSMLSSYLHTASRAHFDAARHVLRYLAGTTTHGISFQSTPNPILVQFLGTTTISHNIATCFTDSSWGPQDASAPDPRFPSQISLISTRSLGGHVVFRTGGPVSWASHREQRTSRSSCEAEILATDDGTKTVQHIRHIMMDLGLLDYLLPTPVFNNNCGCIDWAHTVATRRLRHFNIRENAVRDAIIFEDITLSHIPGPHNPSDLFTKEHKDIAHFRSLVSCFLSPRDLLPPGSMGGADANDTRPVLQMTEVSGDNILPDSPETRDSEQLSADALGISEIPPGTSTCPATSETGIDSGASSGTRADTPSTLPPVDSYGRENIE